MRVTSIRIGCWLGVTAFAVTASLVIQPAECEPFDPTWKPTWTCQGDTEPRHTETGHITQGHDKTFWCVFTGSGREVKHSWYETRHMYSAWSRAASWNQLREAGKRGRYAMGVKYGHWREWEEERQYSHGRRTSHEKKLAAGWYKKDKRHGKWITYTLHDGVSTRVTTHYVKGVEHGAYTSRIAGKLRSRGQHEHGRMVGEWRFWHANGKLSSRAVYRQDGTVKSNIAWGPKGNKIAEDQRVQGMRGGLVRRWSATGELLERGRKRDGKKIGVWRRWYKGGKPRSLERYRNGEKVGIWVTYHRGGGRSRVMEFRDGQLHGVWLTFDKQGKLTKRCRYHQGESQGCFP